MLLDEIGCAKPSTKKQVVQNKRKCERRRPCPRVGFKAQKMQMEDGDHYWNISRKRWMCEKVRIKNAEGEYDRPIHKLCLITTKEELIINDKENKLK